MTTRSVFLSAFLLLAFTTAWGQEAVDGATIEFGGGTISGGVIFQRVVAGTGTESGLHPRKSPRRSRTSLRFLRASILRARAASTSASACRTCSVVSCS